MEYQYKIRAHHGMCIAFFQGKGYSNEFTAHMREMIHKLEKNSTICITTQTDAICLKCPNNIQLHDVKKKGNALCRSDFINPVQIR